MKFSAFIILLFVSSLAFSQNKGGINLTNAVVVGQFEKEDDRYNLEVTLTEFFVSQGVKAIPSLNVLKQGSDLRMLLLDSLKKVTQSKGMDTYVLCRVRGYDRKFKVSSKKEDLETALNYGSLFAIYRDELVSVTFEFLVYRNNELILSRLVRCGNVASREKVLERLTKRLSKDFKKW